MQIEPDTEPAPTPAPTPDPAPAPVPEPTTPEARLTVGQKMKAAFAAVQGRGTSAEVESLRTQVGALTTERDALRAKNQALVTELAEAEQAVTDFNGRVIAQSVEMCASAGVPVSQMPTLTDAGPPQPKNFAELEEAMKGKSVAECREMLREYRARHAGKN